ncbi:hypothetical protein Lepto7375DRAFT_0942 [Leptolyngbya sp. PCC 7375]|nr:hypothetical protein Lepto7375DRAFT_0942 [Leptolyngbya sp. PCC 7375]
MIEVTLYRTSTCLLVSTFSNKDENQVLKPNQGISYSLMAHFRQDRGRGIYLTPGLCPGGWVGDWWW